MLLRLTILSGVLLVATAAMAAPTTVFSSDGNPLDTPATTEVTAEAADNTVGYLDVDANLMPTVEVSGGDVDHQVLVEFGFSGLADTDDDRSVTPGDHITHEAYVVTNEGNVADTYIIYSLFNENAGAQNWTVEVWDQDTNTLLSTIVTSGAWVNNSIATPDNYDMKFRYEVLVPDSVTDAPDGSNIVINTTVETDSTPSASVHYTGGNDLDYGETNSRYISVNPPTDTVQSPVMTLTRESAVDSPTLSTYSGGAHDPVPGAVITFTMYYENTGSATAENVILIDKVSTIESPSGSDSAGARLAHVNADSGSRGVIDLTPANGTGQGWIAYYTTEATLATERTTYEAPGWVSIGSVNSAAYPSSNFYTPSDSQYNARWIKWEKSAVDPAESETLVWGVSIR